MSKVPFISINKNVKRIQRRGPSEIEIAIGKIATSDGFITVYVNHELFEIWDIIEYIDVNVLDGSKTIWVGKSSVNLITPKAEFPTAIYTWDEYHYYKDNAGAYFSQEMKAVDYQTIPPQEDHFKSKDCQNNHFFEKGLGLTGYGEIIYLEFGSAAGPVLWIGINTTVDKELD